MLTPNERRKGGTPVHSSRSLSPILMIQQSTPSAVGIRFCVIRVAATIYTKLLPDAHHRFIAEECDWGFTRFSELRKLFSVQDGFSRPTIEDETADVSVFVRVLEDPTGVLWHNFVKCVYDISFL